MLDTCSCNGDHNNTVCELLGELRPAPDFIYWGDDWPGSEAARKACGPLNYEKLHDAFCQAVQGRRARSSVFEREFIGAVRKLLRNHP